MFVFPKDLQVILAHMRARNSSGKLANYTLFYSNILHKRTWVVVAVLSFPAARWSAGEAGLMDYWGAHAMLEAMQGNKTAPPQAFVTHRSKPTGSAVSRICSQPS